MKCYSGIGFRPYTRLTETEKKNAPYICRLAPGKNFIELEWIDNGGENGETYRVFYRRRLTDFPFNFVETTKYTAILPDLEEQKDYEFYVERLSSGARSDLRLARTGEVPGVVINYLHPSDPIYDFSGRSLCSPSLVKLPSGALLACMDVFSGGAPQNLSLVFRSDDGGESWRYVTDLFPCFWGKLFVHKGILYMMANTTEYGNLYIAKSSDEGKTWSDPVTLLPGASSSQEAGPHKAPMPVILAPNNRLYTGVDYGAWKKGGHANGLLSIDADADLMCAENWSCTGFTAFDRAWNTGIQWESGPGVREPSGLEGNAVVGPDGGIYDFLRLQMSGNTNAYGKALILKGDLEDPEAPLTYYGVADFNGGSNSKFDLLYDEKSHMYWSVASEIVYAAQPNARTVMSLACSSDMIHFKIVKRLLDYRDADKDFVGFQYVSMAIDGDDLIYQCRTSLNGARNFHDANYATFHRIKDFRSYTEEVAAEK